MILLWGESDTSVRGEWYFCGGRVILLWGESNTFVGGE